jgi:hypothetical protein
MLAALSFAQLPSSSDEIVPGSADPEFLRKWEHKRDAVTDKLFESDQRRVRVIYLVPSDKAVRPEYRTAIESAFLDLREFYRRELGSGYSFLLANPAVAVFQTSHPSSFYASTPSRPTAPPSSWFWENALADGFGLTGGAFNDPNNRWIFYIDAEVGCGQVIGGTSGVSLMAANDMRGLTGGLNIPSCAGSPPDNSPPNRWIGGAGHELAHAFNVPHPPGCGSPGGCTGGSTASNSIMWVGYAFYPNTYFLPEDRQILFSSGFFYNTVSIAGRVVGPDGRGVRNGRVTLSSGGELRVSVTNPFGYFRFIGLTAGTEYTLQAAHKSYFFDARQVRPVEDISAFTIVARWSKTVDL